MKIVVNFRVIKKADISFNIKLKLKIGLYAYKK